MRPRNCDTCAHCDRYRTQEPCKTCTDNPTGGYPLWVDPSEAERARCLEIVERLCEQTAEKQSENACRFPRSGEKFRHGSMVVFELLKELSAAIERDE